MLLPDFTEKLQEAYRAHSDIYRFLNIGSSTFYQQPSFPKSFAFVFSFNFEKQPAKYPW